MARYGIFLARQFKFMILGTFYNRWFQNIFSINFGYKWFWVVVGYGSGSGLAVY